MIAYTDGHFRFNYRSAGVFIHQGAVLLQQMIGRRLWILPGGRCERMETSQQTIIREVAEELQIEVETKRLLWIAEQFFHDRGLQFHELCFYYLLQPKSWHSILDQDEFHFAEPDGTHFRLRWFSLDKLTTLDLRPNFLIQGLQQLPKTTKHVVIHDA
jgi:8-oxo-dGTP pyrophosphatase MutT (NUDIX family)